MADMASPNDTRAPAQEVRNEACGLRIVADDEVVGAHECVKCDRILLGDSFERRRLFRAQRRAIPARAMEGVVQSLGDAEERRRTFEHEPTDVDAEASRVA